MPAADGLRCIRSQSKRSQRDANKSESGSACKESENKFRFFVIEKDPISQARAEAGVGMRVEAPD